MKRERIVAIQQPARDSTLERSWGTVFRNGGKYYGQARRRSCTTASRTNWTTLITTFAAAISGINRGNCLHFYTMRALLPQRWMGTGLSTTFFPLSIFHILIQR